MSLSVTITAGKVFATNEKVTNAKLNQLGVPTAAVSGTVPTSMLEALSVTSGKAEFGAWFWGTDSGTATAHVVAITSNVTGTLPNGFLLGYKVNVTNTGAVTVTINPSGGGSLGPYTIKKHGYRDLEAGDLRGNQCVVLRFDQTYFQLVSPVCNEPVVYGADSGSTDDYTITGAPPITALYAGLVAVFKANTQAAAGATLNVNGTGAKVIKKQGSADLTDGDIKAGQWAVVVYDGTYWQLVSDAATGTDTAVPGDALGLRMSGTTGTQTIAVALDGMTLLSTAGLKMLATSVSATVTLTSYQAVNGVEWASGAFPGAGWYKIWLISNGTTTGAYVTSDSPASWPSGYTYRALLGYVYLNASAQNNVSWVQIGRRTWTTPQVVFSGKTKVASYTALSGADLTAFQVAVPPSGTRVARVRLGADNNSGSGECAVAATSAGLGEESTNYAISGSVFLSFYTAGVFECPINGAGNLYWKFRDATGTARMEVLGWEI